MCVCVPDLPLKKEEETQTNKSRKKVLARSCEKEKGSYLVDPASSHMLVSKIKPCMSKYKHFYTVKLQMAH